MNALVGLAPSNHGTTLSGLTKLLDYFPGAGDLIAENTSALMDQVVGSDFLRRLDEGGDSGARHPDHLRVGRLTPGRAWMSAALPRSVRAGRAVRRAAGCYPVTR